MWRHLLSLSLAEWRHHPWRHGVALLAVALGVALASSVQMINASALAEFAQAVRSVNGQPDAVLAAATADGFDDALIGPLALDAAVASTSPVVELDSQGRRRLADPSNPPSAPPPPRVALRVVGIDALQVAATAPDLLPRPAEGAAATSGPAALFNPDAVFLNAAAFTALQVAAGDALALQTPTGWLHLRVAGRVAAGGRPLVVMDIATAQTRFGQLGRLSRIDIRLQPGTDVAAWQARLQASLPPGVRWAQADDAVQRVSNLSRAYRVNLGVLALVALLVGGFLVYSVVSLSVAQRTPALALLGVLGMAARDRRRLVLAESAAVGLAGSAVGLAAGAGLAALALRVLGGDLGGGYFAGGAPSLVLPVWPLLACFGLGTAAAVAGAWFPARQAEALSPAVALKGLGGLDNTAPPWWPGLALLLAGGALAMLPPIAGLPLAAYAAVATLLAGGVVLVPAAVQALLSASAQPRSAVLLLALRRARFARQTASATVAGVVASLALSVAITVMVASFRDAVTVWLDSVLPADLYARSGAAGGAASALPPGLLAQVARLPGVQRVVASRNVPLVIDPQQPAVTLLARPLGDKPANSLPLLGDALPAQAGEIGVWVSEPAAALHHWQIGQRLHLRLPGQPATAPATAVRVRGVWRDYARQFGAIAIDAADYQRLTGDHRFNDLALWLAPGVNAAAVQAALQQAAGPEHPLELASTASLRAMSLSIFDRSFAVTVYLQAVAIGVGLVGVAASLSAQVLARRKEFGLLAHLGLTRRQVIALVGAEAAAWLAAGTLIGLALGLAMAAVLVFVVNPQSFHWTMPLQLPLPRLAALAGAVLAAGVATALWSARRAAGRSAVMAVKEDW
jgi:putative ABC transport system permease protein